MRYELRTDSYNRKEDAIQDDFECTYQLLFIVSAVIHCRPSHRIIILGVKRDPEARIVDGVPQKHPVLVVISGIHAIFLQYF